MYAIILAGGEGKRLRPLTQNIPKPMLEVAGRPFLEHKIIQFERAGVKDIIILEDFKSDVIKDYFGNGARWTVAIQHITYRQQDSEYIQALVKTGLELVPADEQDVFITLGDTYATIDLRDMARAHAESNKLITLLSTKLQIPEGVISRSTSTGLVTLDQKPSVDIYAGTAIVKRSIAPLLQHDLFFTTIVNKHSSDTNIYEDDNAKWWHLSEIKDDLKTINHQFTDWQENYRSSGARG